METEQTGGQRPQAQNSAAALDEAALRRAIALACESVANGGGPFGAVVTQGGSIVAEGSNRVTLDTDPTAHAEVVALRAACSKLGRIDLSDCTLYASCEPCPMCHGAALWSRVGRIVFAAGRDEAARAGFDDAHFHAELLRAPDERHTPVEQELSSAGRQPFDDWLAKSDRATY